MLAVNSSVAVGEGRYIQLIGRDNSGDISKLETFVLDGDTRKSVLYQAFWLLSYYLVPSAFLFLGHLKCQAINCACLVEVLIGGGKTSGIKLIVFSPTIGITPTPGKE